MKTNLYKYEHNEEVDALQAYQAGVEDCFLHMSKLKLSQEVRRLVAASLGLSKQDTIELLNIEEIHKNCCEK